MLRRYSIIVFLFLTCIGCSNSGSSSQSGGTTIEVSKTAQAELEALELEKRKLQAELENTRLRAEIEQVKRGQVSPSTTRNIASAQADFSVAQNTDRSSQGTERGQATLAFWNEMNTVIETEASMRAAPKKVTHGNAGGFVDSRIEAGTFAVQALKSLSRENVDDTAIELADALIAWYADGVKVSKMAHELLGSSTVVRKGFAGKKWSQAEMKHNKAVKRVNQLGAKARQQLAARYKLPFPPLK